MTNKVYVEYVKKTRIIIRCEGCPNLGYNPIQMMHFCRGETFGYHTIDCSIVLTGMPIWCPLPDEVVIEQPK